jgi:hypothetical protein
MLLHLTPICSIDEGKEPVLLIILDLLLGDLDEERLHLLAFLVLLLLQLLLLGHQRFLLVLQTVKLSCELLLFLLLL